MNVILECKKSVSLNLSMYEGSIKEICKGDIIKSEFNDIGVSLFIDNKWSLEFAVGTIDRYFKVYQ